MSWTGKTFAAKHNHPTFRGHPVVYLPPALYDAAAAAGVEMGYYRKVELIPLDALDREKLRSEA